MKKPEQEDNNKPTKYFGAARLLLLPEVLLRLDLSLHLLVPATKKNGENDGISAQKAGGQGRAEQGRQYASRCKPQQNEETRIDGREPRVGLKTTRVTSPRITLKQNNAQGKPKPVRSLQSKPARGGP